MLSDGQIKKFQELYKKHYGEEISRDLAYEKASKIINLIESVYKPAVDNTNKSKNEHDNKL